MRSWSASPTWWSTSSTPCSTRGSATDGHLSQLLRSRPDLRRVRHLRDRRADLALAGHLAAAAPQPAGGRGHGGGDRSLPGRPAGPVLDAVPGLAAVGGTYLPGPHRPAPLRP